MSQHPLPAYHFIVDWGGSRSGFSEVTGLDMCFELAEYRDGSEPGEVVHKLPGLTHFSNVTLKRGILKGDNDFFNWMSTKKLNVIERRDVMISLLNENHEPVIRWKLHNAFPVKLSGPVLVANSNEVAMEELELTHEGMTIEMA